MRLDTSQFLRLDQRMKLAPRMIQAMEILQLPLMALQERIESELVSNPVLEVQEGGDETPEPSEETAPEARGDRDLVVKDNNDQAEDFQRLDAYQKEYEPDVWSGDNYRPARATAGERDPKLDAMANAPAHGQSLYEYLLDQWAFVETDEATHRAGGLIIQHLDEDGRLGDPLAEMATNSDGSVTLADLQAALPLVQQLDPIGVAARDLRECLLLQLASRAAAGEAVELESELVRSFLRDIEMNRLPQVARKTGQSVERIKQAITSLSRLNLFPGRLIGERVAPPIQPDIVVEIDDDGELTITMTDGRLPPLNISRAYRRMARGGRLDRNAKDFLQKNIRSAHWLIGAIRQRRQTVHRVAEEVFKVQRDFFEHGRSALKPLPMADIAEKVGVHIATISRAVAGKYVQTPRGIFPLRMFFSGGTQTDGGKGMAWDAVRAKLQEIIDAEDKAKPLNDDELVAKLQDTGIKIARRTVAKYRKLMSIPPARQRRQF